MKALRNIYTMISWLSSSLQALIVCIRISIPTNSLLRWSYFCSQRWYMVCSTKTKNLTLTCQLLYLSRYYWLMLRQVNNTSLRLHGWALTNLSFSINYTSSSLLGRARKMNFLTRWIWNIKISWSILLKWCTMEHFLHDVPKGIQKNSIMILQSIINRLMNYLYEESLVIFIICSFVSVCPSNNTLGNGIFWYTLLSRFLEYDNKHLS